MSVWESHIGDCRRQIAAAASLYSGRFHYGFSNLPVGSASFVILGMFGVDILVMAASGALPVQQSHIGNGGSNKRGLSSFSVGVLPCIDKRMQVVRFNLRYLRINYHKYQDTNAASIAGNFGHIGVDEKEIEQDS